MILATLRTILGRRGSFYGALGTALGGWRNPQAAELFARAWYGGRDTGPEEAARFGELARTVEGATAKGTRSSGAATATAVATGTAERPESTEDGDR